MNYTTDIYLIGESGKVTVRLRAAQQTRGDLLAVSLISFHFHILISLTNTSRIIIYHTYLLLIALALHRATIQPQAGKVLTLLVTVGRENVALGPPPKQSALSLPIRSIMINCQKPRAARAKNRFGIRFSMLLKSFAWKMEFKHRRTRHK